MVTRAALIAAQTPDMIRCRCALLVVALTGLGVTFDYEFMAGKAHPFMAITHAVSVILFLVWLPFGKFFHIFQRPAQLGVDLYKREGARQPAAVCPHTGEPFAPQMQIDDLKAVTGELGFDFSLAGGGSHLDLARRGNAPRWPRASGRQLRERAQ